jgi:hypothetical protein
LRARQQQHCADQNQQHRRDAAKEVLVKPGGKADGGDEQSDGDERQRESAGKRQRTEAVLAERGPHHNRYQRQHARRKSRQ